MRGDLYATTARAWGGRSGRVESADGRLGIDLSMPTELGGVGGPGTNPEQLFAAAYAACFHSALKVSARAERLDVSASAVTVTVGVNANGGATTLTVRIEVELPGLSAEVAYRLVDAAHALCLYSRATRGNIAVEVLVVQPD